jgi:DNA-binding winged helix-turn-helix (wHTH) protein
MILDPQADFLIRDDSVISITQQEKRFLLALLRAGGTATLDDIPPLVWGGMLPSDPDHSLEVIASRIRAKLKRAKWPDDTVRIAA